MGMDCCSSEDRNISSFHYDFTELFRCALGKYDKMPESAEEQATVFLKLMKYLSVGSEKELVDKVYELQGKLQKAKALNQEPIDEFGAALDKVDSNESETDMKEDTMEDDED